MQSHNLICTTDYQHRLLSLWSDFLLCYFWFLWGSHAILLHWLTQSWFPSCYKLPSFAFRLFNCSEWVPSLPEALHTSPLETLWMKPVSAPPTPASIPQTSVTHTAAKAMAKNASRRFTFAWRVGVILNSSWDLFLDVLCLTPIHS